MRSARGSHQQRWAWFALALLVFGIATVDRYAAVFEAGLRRAIPSRAASARGLSLIRRTDQQFVVWAVSRNARTLARRPLQLYDAEQCFPAVGSLALGEPVLAMGILGIPAQLATDDPVLTYNLVMLLMSLCAALAMYWLIVEWTGMPAAGIVAGLVYAFHGLAVSDPVHPYSSDTTWMILSLLFSTRLFALGHWRDAAGLAASGSMQLATSFYSFVAAALIGSVFLIWLGFGYRLRHVKPAQIACVGGVLLVAGAVIFGPYLETRADGVLVARGLQLFRSWSAYGPAGSAFFGWPALLVLAGLTIPARLSLRRLSGDPRPALVIGGLLVAAVAAGSSGTLGVNVYAWLSDWAPGFDTVRIPWKISIGVHLVSSLLAGIGAAGLIAGWPGAARSGVGGALISICLAMLVWWPSQEKPVATQIRPREAALRFFEILAATGNDGPLFETPIPRTKRGYAWSATAPQLLLAAYHHRPTTACYPSHAPPHLAELQRIEARLPDSEAIQQLGDLGFTTILVHHGIAPRASQRQDRAARVEAFRRLAEQPNAPIRRVHADRRSTAYEIVQLEGRAESEPLEAQ